ncbi:MAG: hypothetical protein MUW56_02430 [Chryseobacterium sp.]|uniref:AbiTii domain-containing protein n=1 Tax=Chryseobacterium sp. TaxID=1871047 RepID=UPI0025C5628D|nr:hypothetical protein [Chryseobacterium sp.]MCJ7932506.1 hypothetical protein [Chryseobacterium sp.]
MDNTNNFILQEVINDLVDSKTSLISPLMKLNYFGRLIKNQELIDFTSKEIKGYSSRDDFPEYRMASQRLIANVRGFMIEQDMEVPISMLEEPFDIGLQKMYVFDGIETIEKMAKEMLEDRSKNEIYRPIPMEMLPPIQTVIEKIVRTNSKIYIQHAKTVSNSHIFLEIQSHIRTKLLELVMEIGEKFGYNILIESFKLNSLENNQIINNIMNTTINNSGDGNILNTGDNNNISNSSKIIKNDVESLKTELRKYDIEEQDIIEIAEIVQEENLDENNNLGEKSRNWILKILDKSMQGIGKISTAVSANLLATAIKGYYGIEF